MIRVSRRFARRFKIYQKCLVNIFIAGASELMDINLQTPQQQSIRFESMPTLPFTQHNLMSINETGEALLFNLPMYELRKLLQ